MKRDLYTTPFMVFRTPDGRLDVGEASHAWSDIGARLGVSFREFLDRVCFRGPAQSIVIPLPLPIYRALRGGARRPGRDALPIARLLPPRRKKLGP